MDITKLIEQIRSQVDGEAAEKIDATLKEIQLGVTSLIEDVKAASSESKKRKLTIRGLQGDLETMTVDRDELQKKIEEAEKNNSSEELETLRKFKASTIEKNRSSFLKTYESIQKHANFDKAKSLFQVPEKPEDMTDEMLESNLSELERLNNLNYFGDIKLASTDQNPPADAKSFIEKVNGAKSIKELEEIQAAQP